MKRLLMLPIAVLAAILVAVTAGAATQTVQVTKNGFTPQSATVNVGDTVTWHNADTANHQIVADDGSFASPVLHSDQTYSHTFTSAGTEKYHDAYAKTHTGTITITAPTPAPSVTLSPGRSTIVYGSGTTLSGSISSNLASEPVTLTAQAYGKSAQSIDQVTTTSNGDFQFSVSPTIQTTYQSHWRTADSQSVIVNVAPRIGFSRSGNVFIAKATSDLAYSGHFVWVQRHYGFGWKSVKRVFLGSNSRAVFRMTLPHGRSLLRLVMPTGQAGAGYVSGLSRTISVLRHR
jgi:plastocyanin